MMKYLGFVVPSAKASFEHLKDSFDPMAEGDETGDLVFFAAPPFVPVEPAKEDGVSERGGDIGGDSSWSSNEKSDPCEFP